MDDIEVWVPVPDYVGLYEVSTEGRFRRFGSHRPIGVEIQKSGYAYVSFSKDGVQKRYRAHRIVLSAHARPPVGIEQTRHLNGRRADNRLSNLAWGTSKENAADRAVHGTARGAHSGEDHHNATLSDADLHVVRYQRGLGMTHKAIADLWGVSRRTIGNILSGKSRSGSRAP